MFLFMNVKKILLKIKKILFYKKYKFFRIIQMIFKKDQRIYINNQELVLPPGHLLSMYNSLYPEYDKFIVGLVSKLDPNSSIIDIGANVGDTLMRLIQGNSKLNYFSIEADNYFFKYLKKNKEKIYKNYNTQITLINELVGLNLVGNLNNTKSGTKTLIENKEGVKTKTLDDIILDNNIINIAFIKVDVDGYDYNVLASGIENIKKYKPMLFFEYMSLNKDKYLVLLEELYVIGYKKWTIINNYGYPIFENKDYNEVVNFINSKNDIITDIYCYY